jgi:cellulose synthase/poly-beta-1,6-N-acetylglucosamine synthase-like glycosyltransferase
MIVKYVFWISIFLIVYSYALYPLILILMGKFCKRGGGQGAAFSQEQPGVSLVIAAFNEEKVIRGKIENCLALAYPRDRLEIIVGSDGSRDRTNTIVREYASQSVVLLDHGVRRGKVNVLNDVIPRAKHDVIVFSDANTLFASDAIRRLVRHFSDPRVGCVCGELTFVNAEGSKSGELEGVYWRYETFLKKIEGSFGSLLGANGAIYAIRKNLFSPCPSDTIVEDLMIPMRILEKGYRVIYDPEARAIEEAAKHIVQEKERRIRIGAGDFQALFRLLAMLNPLRGFSALAFWSHKVLRWFGPFFMMTAFIMNLFLIPQPMYFILFIGQFLFYTLAWAGKMLSRSGKSLKLLRLCYYFVSMNLALFWGFIRFASGTQRVAWERMER